MFKKNRGFTLIELLIVVAIIAILAAIAIPNFLLAQVRAKVSRVQGEFRSLATAIESYSVDQGAYPGNVDANRHGEVLSWYVELTTPVAYITSIPQDPFASTSDLVSAFPKIRTYSYAEGGWQAVAKQYNPGLNLSFICKWVIVGQGPNSRDDQGEWITAAPNGVPFVYIGFMYDPTNGTISNGDIVRWGP